jgi:hypothetical protein
MMSESCSSLFDDVSFVGRYTWISNYTGCVVGAFVVLHGLATQANFSRGNCGNQNFLNTFNRRSE